MCRVGDHTRTSLRLVVSDDVSVVDSQMQLRLCVVMRDRVPCIPYTCHEHLRCIVLAPTRY